METPLPKSVQEILDIIKPRGGKGFILIEFDGNGNSLYSSFNTSKFDHATAKHFCDTYFKEIMDQSLKPRDTIGEKPKP